MDIKELLKLFSKSDKNKGLAQNAKITFTEKEKDSSSDKQSKEVPDSKNIVSISEKQNEENPISMVSGSTSNEEIQTTLKKHIQKN